MKVTFEIFAANYYSQAFLWLEPSNLAELSLEQKFFQWENYIKERILNKPRDTAYNFDLRKR